MRLVPLTAAAALASALLLAGCTGSSDGPTAGASLDPDDSPLSVFFEKLGGDPADQSEKAARSEEVVAACMQEQGFEYTPMDYGDAFDGANEADDDQPDWDSLEFAEQYGYGASTGDDLSSDGGATEFEDPNADYVAQMSETEQTAYYEALYGQAPTEEPDSGDDVEEEDVEDWDWTTAGCQGKAQHEVYEETQVWEDPKFQDLTDELTSVYEDAQSGKEVVAANKAWAQCMSGEGYDFDKPDDASQSIWDALAEVPGFDEGSQDPADLVELKKTEIATAVADRTCQESTKYQQILLASQFAVEQAFVDRHKAELDELVAAATKDAG